MIIYIAVTFICGLSTDILLITVAELKHWDRDLNPSRGIKICVFVVLCG
jgi:hypothetical protein